MAAASTVNQRERRRQHSCERLLTAAVAEFADKGFDGAATREIAAAAGLRQSLIPYHFGSKEGLWRAAVDSVVVKIDAAMAAAVDPAAMGGSREEVGRLLTAWLQASAAHPEYLRIILREMGQPGPRLEWLVATHTRRHRKRGVRFLKLAQRHGLNPSIDPDHLAYIIFGAVGAVVAGAPEVALNTGRDPLTPAFLRGHAAALMALLFPDTTP